MSRKVAILGAKGRFGRAAVGAFHAAGWRVRAVARSWQDATLPLGIDAVTGNAFDADALSRATAGTDVIVNALNPPYTRWQRDLPRLTESVIAAAKVSGATVMIPGNVYNFGAGMPGLLTETTPHVPTTRKGRLREQMEQAFRQAGADGVRTVVLRAGDFIERQRTGNWFDSHIANNVGRGRVVYPGRLDRLHAWAYLPDMARAMAGLADHRGDFAAFADIGFPGYALTGRELIAAMERVTGRTLHVGAVPWWLIRLFAVASPGMREVAEMAYLWHTPHAIDGAKLAAILPDFRPTPLDTAMADALADSRGDATPLQLPTRPQQWRAAGEGG